MCGGYAVIKGVGWSSGNVRGTAMIDGSYGKSNDVDKGRWFTWSWGKGKNAGEVDEEFGGLYMMMNFDVAHEWMARDDFGATWGYLVNGPQFLSGTEDTSPSVLVLNGRDQFVELQSDVADMRDVSIKVKVNWQGTGNARILDCSNDKGDSVTLGIAGGKCVFVIAKDGKSQVLKGPAMKKGVWTEVLVVLSEDTGRLFLDGKEVGRNDTMTWNPDDIKATQCYLGRGRNGDYFKGQIDNLAIYSVPLKDEVPPLPDPAQFAMGPIFANPSTVVMQAVPGVDPLGGVEYLFEETSGNSGGDDSGWLKEPVYEDSGLTKGKAYTYRVKMRDTCGNATGASAAAMVKWEEAKAFTSTDGKTIVVEAESYTRSAEGSGDGRGIQWKLSPNRAGCAGKGLMAALPDKGVQIDSALKNQCPRLDYLIDFPEKGKYTIWMRTWGAHPGSDSIHFGLDMKTTDRSLFHTGNGKLQWQRHRDWTFEVDEPGLHTLSVWMREDGCAFDRLIITCDQKTRTDEPAGQGPAESPLN